LWLISAATLLHLAAKHLIVKWIELTSAMSRSGRQKIIAQSSMLFSTSRFWRAYSPAGVLLDLQI
jgi:hypothetical protein